MKFKILMPTLIALGLSMSGAVHALLIMMPDGTKAEAQVSGNKLMLLDASGKSTPARDGIYKTSAGAAIIVRGGVIASQAALTGPIDSKSRYDAAANPPVQTVPRAASPPGQASATPPVAGSAVVNVVRIEQLSSKAQFKALPDDTLLEIDGKKVRKVELVADFNRRAAARSPAPAIQPPAPDATQARPTADDDAAIAASDADVRKGVAAFRAKGGTP